MKKRVLSLFLIIILLITAFPLEGLAASGSHYFDSSGNLQTASNVKEITETTNELTTGWYLVNSDVERTESIIVTGDVHLILADESTLTVTGDNNKAAVNVSEGNSLTIYGQEKHTGKLIANSGYRWGVKDKENHYNVAAIGGGEYENCGTITINGGQIVAEGTSNGAGIGGGYMGHCGVITINGGEVTASCLTKEAIGRGAGIGSGENAGYVKGTYKQGKNAGSIIINGGIVNASGDMGAGIGGGYKSDGGNIEINGGIVNAISYGFREAGYKSSGSGAGIGGGCSQRTMSSSKEPLLGSGGNIKITAGTVTAKGDYGGAGIGGGGFDILEDKDKVGASGGNIIISGGRVIATSKTYGAGIGGGQRGDGGNVKISNGVVFAQGYKDVGGGYPNEDGQLTISGDTVLFLKNNNSVEVDTITHEHKTFSSPTLVKDYDLPASWDKEFGAWLPEGPLVKKDATLKGISIAMDSGGGGKIKFAASLNPAFDPSIKTYNVVKKDNTRIQIIMDKGVKGQTAIATMEGKPYPIVDKADRFETDIYYFTEPNSEFIVTVKSKDGSNTETYKIIITNEEKLTGKVTISGKEEFGEFLTARVSDTNNTGTLSYLWTRSSGVGDITTGNTYYVDERFDAGNIITCKVTSSVQTGSISASTGRILDSSDDKGIVESEKDETNKDITIRVSSVAKEKLNLRQKESIGDNTVYEILVTCG